MPYRRRARTYRRRRGRTPWYNRKYSTMQLARKAWSATKYLKGLVNSERMYLSQTINLAAKSNIFQLNALPVGDVSGTRTGNSILMRSLYLRGFIQINPAVTVNTRIGMVLLWDTQQVSDTIPAITDIFDNNDPEATLRTSANGYSAGRFKIISRKTFNLIPGQHPTHNIDKYRKLYKHAKFNGSNSSDIQKNGLYLVILTSEVANFPTVNITSKLGYHDN